MEDLRRGNIAFVYGRGFISRLIQIVETGTFRKRVPSHVAIVYNDKMLIEANFKGVMIVPVKKYRKCKVVYAEMNPPRDIDKGLLWAELQIGTRYDFAQLGGILARSFWRLFGKKVYNKSKRVRNFLNSKTRFICSEFLEMYASLTGGRLWHGKIGFVTPWDIMRSGSITFID